MCVSSFLLVHLFCLLVPPKRMLVNRNPDRHKGIFLGHLKRQSSQVYNRYPDTQFAIHKSQARRPIPKSVRGVGSARYLYYALHTFFLLLNYSTYIYLYIHTHLRLGVSTTELHVVHTY